jgi:hypothetical protein
LQTPVSIQEKAMASLTEQQARAVIAPWYGLFNVAGRGGREPACRSPP